MNAFELLRTLSFNTLFYNINTSEKVSVFMSSRVLKHLLEILEMCLEMEQNLQFPLLQPAFFFFNWLYDQTTIEVMTFPSPSAVHGKGQPIHPWRSCSLAVFKNFFSLLGAFAWCRPQWMHFRVPLR